MVVHSDWNYTSLVFWALIGLVLTLHCWIIYTVGSFGYTMGSFGYTMGSFGYTMGSFVLMRSLYSPTYMYTKCNSLCCRVISQQTGQEHTSPTSVCYYCLMFPFLVGWHSVYVESLLWSEVSEV